MLDIAIDAKLQVTAGIALLETSKLVTWDYEAEEFSRVSQPDFERALRRFHPVFGRVICWIIFSAGAEFLAKGVCLHRGDSKLRKPQCVPAIPSEDVATWLETFNLNSEGTVPRTNFGQIRNLYDGHLRSLCNNETATQHEEKRLLAAYEILGRTIRNRDAHAYVPKERAEHFFLVSELFIPAMNDLLRWMRLPAGELNKWRKTARQFIKSLGPILDHEIDKSICKKLATSKNARAKKMKHISQRLDTYSEGELDGVISFLDQWEPSINEEGSDLAEQGMTDYANALAEEDSK